ncbi:MAG: GNAT family N-acetyltransferase, partial [Candidatus Thorarchaeota archaeon]
SIYLFTTSFNERGQRAYEKAGFKRGGLFRQACYIQGEFHDMITMDILKDEFLEMYPPGKFVGEA